jgi:hypothetical protein
VSFELAVFWVVVDVYNQVRTCIYLEIKNKKFHYREDRQSHAVTRYFDSGTNIIALSVTKYERNVKGNSPVHGINTLSKGFPHIKG